NDAAFLGPASLPLVHQVLEPASVGPGRLLERRARVAGVLEAQEEATTGGIVEAIRPTHGANRPGAPQRIAGLAAQRERQLHCALDRRAVTRDEAAARAVVVGRDLGVEVIEARGVLDGRARRMAREQHEQAEEGIHGCLRYRRLRARS